MDRVYKSGASAVKTTLPATVSYGYPTNGSQLSPATEPGAEWYYMITEEMRAVIAAAGITPDHKNTAQLLAAINALIASGGAGSATPSTPIIPLRTGPVGIPPTRYWRIGITDWAGRTRAGGDPGIIPFIPRFFDDVGFAQLSTNSLPTTLLVNLLNIMNGTTMRGMASDSLHFINPANPGYIELTFPTAIAPMAYMFLDTLTMEVIDFTVEASFDAGTTWSVLSTVVGHTYAGACFNSIPYYTRPSANVPTVNFNLDTPTYPLNPYQGQKFFNETTGLDMKWATNQWVSVNKKHIISTNATLNIGDDVAVDASAVAISLNVPVGASGDLIKISDLGGNWAINNVTLIPTVQTIMGIAGNYILSVSNSKKELICTGTDWRVV